MDSVIWLKDIGSQQEGIGHKAKVNADLFQAGFTVPDGFVICADAFNISEQQLVTVGSGGTTLVEKFPYLKPDIRPQLKEHLTTLGDAENKFAVRSSGIGEDGDRHSFAGQFMSFLNVEPQQVVQKAIDVWKSAQSDQLFAYCSSHQLNKSPQSIAVLVQQMVQADISGVAFGADPVSGRRNVVVINAVAELGDRLMAGSVTGQTYEVNRLQQISQRPAETALLTDTQVFEIAELVRRVGEYFGSPQDVEWAIADNTLYLLQARPITTLHQLPNPEGNFQLWDNSNIVESYSGITTPLTFSFARKAYTEVYKQFCRFMGVPDQEIAKNQRIFRNMIGLIRGRIYYNLLNWYRLLAMLPAAKLNARFMEQMMGVKEGPPDEVLTEIQTLAQSKTWGDRWRMILTFGQLLLNFLNLDRRIIRYHQRINKAVTLKATETRPADMTQWHMHELADYYRQLEEELLAHWDAPLINDFFAMIFYGLLRRCTEKWCGDQTGSLHNALIADTGQVISAEPLTLITAMAEELDEQGVNLFSQGELSEIQHWLSTKPSLRQKYQSYLDKFGDRCLGELKLESPTLRDQPLLLFRAIAQLAQPKKSKAIDSAYALRETAEAQVKEALGIKPIKRIVFSWILAQARTLIRNRENLRFERTRVFGLARRIFSELGKHLTDAKQLSSPQDIFYLEVEEILSFIGGTATCNDLKSLVAVRKAEFTRYNEQPAPGDRFSTYGAVYQGNNFQSEVSPSTPTKDADIWQGESCAPGRVKGQIQLIKNPAEFLQARHSESATRYILVAESTDPGWILLFPQASGLLVERGSVLSHVAIVCRELGLPMITNLSGITRCLNNDDWVEINGQTGTIRKLND